MQYLYFGFILIFIFSALWIVWSYNRRLKRDFLKRCLEKAVMKQRNKLPADTPYSSEVILKIVRWLAKQKPYKIKIFYEALQDTNFKKFMDMLKHTGQIGLAKKLSVLLGENKRANLYEGAKALHAAVLLKEAKARLKEADFLGASEKSSAAAKLFEQLRFGYEEAEAYFVLGTVYRVSAVFDVADMMLKTAQKIFHHLNAKVREAECLGNLGMLMTAQNRFEEAYVFFEKAAAKYEKNNNIIGKAEVENQAALTLLLEGEYQEALQKATEVFKTHQLFGNLQGMAFSQEIICYLHRAQNQWAKAKLFAEKAAKLHKICDNTASFLEMRFVAAEALFESNQPQKSEKILREIIAHNGKNPSCFQVANSYNLLGLIYMNQQDFKRAETLFQQSLACEIQNDRSLGALIDYANIAQAFNRRGNLQQEQKYLKMALDYAQDLQEKELSALLEKRLIQTQAPSE